LYNKQDLSEGAHVSTGGSKSHKWQKKRELVAEAIAHQFQQPDLNDVYELSTKEIRWFDSSFGWRREEMYRALEGRIVKSLADGTVVRAIETTKTLEGGKKIRQVTVSRHPH
jgi:hypothetical protein